MIRPGWLVIRSPLANTDVSGEENRAGQGEEDPNDQPDHVTVTDAAVGISAGQYPLRAPLCLERLESPRSPMHRNDTGEKGGTPAHPGVECYLEPLAGVRQRTTPLVLWWLPDGTQSPAGSCHVCDGL